MLRQSLLAASAALALSAGPTLASESGSSLYLLGTGGPGAAILPPVSGVFLNNSYYHYDGKAERSRQFTVGGNVVAGLEANIDADFLAVIWVPPVNLMGATVAVGAILPAGVPDVEVSAVITGPRGRTATISRSEDKFIVGDPVLTGALGWTKGDLHWQVAALLNVPIGNYRPGHLANLAFHRWALDTSVAVSWHDPKSGWDISGKTGLTFNGENPNTDYDTGTEWHVEAAVEKRLSPKFSLGVQAYYFSQVTGDSGPGATLGDFKGQVTGIGATAAYDFKIAKAPATLRLRAFTEMDSKNRLEGDAVMLDFSMPLWVPAAARP